MDLAHARELRPTAWIAALSPQRRHLYLALLMTAIGSVVMAFALPRIDFHADEAIYLTRVPVNTGKDSGLVFHAAYLSTGGGALTPLSARWTSLLLGCVLIFSTTRVVQLLVPSRAQLAGVLIPLSMVISYQGIFTILRVRPEISWVAVASLACWCLAELRTKDSWLFRGLLILSLLLLPMNHLLSLFPAFFLGCYLILFARTRLGNVFTGIAVSAMGVGLILNHAVRTWMVDGQLHFLPALGGGSEGQRLGLGSFLKNVYWHSPLFLKDAAVNDNLWSSMNPFEADFATSHCFVATMIWAIALPLPLVMRTWESRFVASIPLATLGLFYASGYFNPTYSPILTIYAVAIYGFMVVNRSYWVGNRAIAAAILVVTILNGGSFLATRVLNHGPATFFEVEALLREKIAALPPETVISVPERFQSAMGDRAQKHVLFKGDLPEDIDIIVLDNYDFEMYRFVPDYDKRQQQIATFASNAKQLEDLALPVYQGEKLFPQTAENTPLKTVQGSWFFRNSVNYTVSILENSAEQKQLASRKPNSIEHR
ncbi:hypothetical protein Pan97_06790 [Bremerella volcania]|uniref:Glycosyltransferase RgtA/B/C/D-like domain-containing protein n=1 Tax=Bremerella volcania TaxID=2527984 RepID=A0A518C378_9BACT|nr:hypothetical protein [Bremerella volcania]QDU73681.1 hypothetical protein Pan97_06790 [Bremerella volcania]